MGKKLVVVLMVTACIGLVASGAFASESTLIFATQSPGTSWYAYATVMSGLISTVLPQGYKVDVQTISPGGLAAPFLIAEGKAHLTFANAAAVKWALEGTVPGRPKISGVTALAGGFDTPFLVVIFTDNFVKKTGIATMEDLVKKKHPVRIAVKALGSFGEIACKHVFSAYGVTYDDIKSWGGSITHTGPAQIVDLLRDDKADITIDHIPAGQAAISELCMTTKVHFIQLPDEIIAKLNQMGWDTYVMPAGTWKGQEKDIKTVGSGTVLIATDKLPGDVAYAITKKLCESKKELVSAFAALEVFDPATAWKPLKCGAPLHPGAEKYYKEKGYMK
ncbi:MAG: TAXI family TRAP transporter solute-binding subunit [Synergistetes bacterium]|nr:TAXI family TRAP transporter solute-binding subunit [Synergistota bacterium]MDW8192618.1 TAXI family TRAP transporter solute-binding subunit [Synergistota bacterium]